MRVEEADFITIPTRDVARAKAFYTDVFAAGGAIMGTVDRGVCHMGFIKDSDGNTIILHRRYTQHG